MKPRGWTFFKTAGFSLSATLSFRLVSTTVFETVVPSAPAYDIEIHTRKAVRSAAVWKTAEALA